MICENKPDVIEGVGGAHSTNDCKDNITLHMGKGLCFDHASIMEVSVSECL